MTDDEQLQARVALACLLEPGTRQVYELVTSHGPVGALERLLAADPAGELGGAVAARVARADPRQLADTVLRRTRQLGARVVTPDDDEWPRHLDDLRLLGRQGAHQRVDRDGYPPVCLWVRGEPGLADAVAYSVAVVGARAATSYGTHVATELGYGLAGREWTVVSGGAFGIDAAAHRGALSASGLTVAVLACGVDRAYPVAHASLYEQIAERGLVVSEWPPGSDPHRHRFLVRNRVIAALTRGTVMVEANARSGARQTLGRAAALGRSIMVVPGPVTSAMSVGCHQAQRQLGARLVTTYDEVLEEVGRIGDDLAPIPRGPERGYDALPPEHARILDGVPARASADVATIAACAGVPLRDVLRALPSLRDFGFVEEREDGWRALPGTARTAPFRPE
jgi:DNA processing protein